MIVLLTGAPGAGKGTQADLLVERAGFAKISTGDALRRQVSLGSEIGKRAESIMSIGKLVPDEVLIQVLQAELGRQTRGKILLDGYPRNIAQAETLESLSDTYPIEAVIHLQVADEVLVGRLVERRVCADCGASYHLRFDPPKDGTCRRCGGAVVQRPDDSEDKVKVRLKVYYDATAPVLDFYERKGLYRRVDGDGPTEVVYQRILGALTVKS